MAEQLLTDEDFDAARPVASTGTTGLLTDEDFDAALKAISPAKKKKRTTEDVMRELYPEPPGPIDKAVGYAGQVGRNIGEAFAPAVTGVTTAVTEAPGLLSRIGSSLGAAFRAKAPEVEPTTAEPLPERGVAQDRRPGTPGPVSRQTMPRTDLPGLEGEMPGPPQSSQSVTTSETRPQDMPEDEAARRLAARFGRGPEGIYADRGPTPQGGLLARALTAVGLRDPAVVQQRRVARENAQAALAVNGMEPIQSEIPGQVLSGISSGVTAGLDEALLDAFGYSVPQPRTTAGGIARGLGHLGGFVAGAPMAAGKATGEAVTKAFTDYLAPRITSPTTATIAAHLGKHAATLGAATGTAETGKALQQEDILSAAKTYGKAAGQGALLGTVFGAIPGTQSFAETLNVGNTAAQAARYGLGLALTDLAQGHYPADGRPWQDQAFDYALNAFFLFQGRNAPSLLRQIETEAARRNVKPDDLFRGISNQMVADHVAEARAAKPGLFDVMVSRIQARNPGFSREMAEYQAARLILGEPGVGHGVATEATEATEPAPPPPPERGVAPVTFVGYDQTKSPAEPMFTVSGDLQMPWGPAARGQLIPGPIIIEAGYGLPDYPKAPKGGGHEPGLVPESENVEARAKQEQTVGKDADKIIAEAEKEGATAVKDLDPETLPEPPWTVPEPQAEGEEVDLDHHTRRLETAARIPADEEGLPDWAAQLGEAIGQAEQYRQAQPENMVNRDLDDAIVASKLVQRAATVDPEGLLEVGDVLNRTADLIREADSGVPGQTWMREAKDVVGELKEAETGSGEPTKTLIQQYRKALEETIKGQTPKAPEKPKAKPEPEPEPETQPTPAPAVEPAPGAPEGESEGARRLREKREAAAAKKPSGGQTVPRPTVSPTPGDQPPPAATERPVVGRPAPTERPAGGVSTPPAGGKFGASGDAARRLAERRRGARGGEGQGLATPDLIEGLAAPIGGSEDMADLFELGGAIHQEGTTDPAAWQAAMQSQLAELGMEDFAPTLPAIRDLVEVTSRDTVYDLGDLRDMLEEGTAAFLRTAGERAAWNAAMEPILGAEEGAAYQDPLYRLVQSYLGEGGAGEEGAQGEPEPGPQAPGVEDGRPPEEVPPEAIPQAPGERGVEPTPPAEGGSPGGPVGEPGGGGGESTGGAGAPGAGGLPGPGGEHGFGDPGQPRVPAVTPGRDIILTEEILQLGRPPAQRFRENVEAIQLLRELQAENRQATPEEQRVLAKFVGWGGLRDYFRSNNPHRPTLIKLLSAEEYQAALESSDAAFYTDPAIAWKVWDLVQRLGFTGGRVLEPSGGSGIFFGTQPDAEASKRIAVELEPISAAILKQLYPQARVHHEGFEDHVTPDNFFDLTIGNPPFSGAGVHDASDDRRYQRAGLANQIHDFFFAKGLDKVRPGGLLVYLSSLGTMDKVNPNVREWLAQRAELVGAIRLPVGAMSRYGTKVGTDIIVLKKRPAPIPLEQAKREPWISLVEIPRDQIDGTVGMPVDYVGRVNQYWADHPEHLIGEWQLGGQYRDTLATALEDMTTLPGVLDTVIGTFPVGTMDARPTNPATDPTNPETIRFLLPEAGAMPKPGGFIVVDGGLWINAGDKDDAGNPVLTGYTERAFTPGQIQTIASILGVRDAAREVLRAQLMEQGDEAMQAAQAELNRVYDAHLVAHARPATKATKKTPAAPARPGYFHNREHVSLISEDPDWGFILSLEVGPNANGHYDKADIFFKRTIPRLEDITRAETPQDAMLLSLARTGRLDWPLMISLYPQSLGPSPVGLVSAFTHPADPRMHPQYVPTTAELLQEALGDAIYLNPETGQWETDDAYLSGNVRTKLKAAEAATKIEPKYQRNVERLQGVIPDDVPQSEISMDLGEAMIPPEYIAAYANDLFGTRGVTATFVPALSLWTLRWSGSREIRNVLATEQWGTARVNGLVLLEMALNNKLALVKNRISDNPPRYVVDKKATKRARLIQAEMREKFSGRTPKGEVVGTGWIWEDVERATELNRAYNEKYNAIVNRTYRAPKALTFPGLNPGWAEMMRQSQKDDVWRILVGGNTLITRIVGSGKTLIMVASMLEGKRLGIWQKPMMVVPNPIMQQTEASIRGFYPAANLLVASEGALNAGRRERFLGQIATGNWDVILVPHSSFGLISVSPGTQRAYIEERIEELMIALINAGGAEGDAEGETRPRGDRASPTVREIATQIRRWRKKLRDLLEVQKGKKSVGLHFEELGVDMMAVDEAHYFKNLKLPSHLSGVAGLPSTESTRAIDLHMKSRILAARNGERGLVLASGTPVNNSLLETYVMMSYLMPARLKAMGMYPLDTWLASYARVTTELEFTAQGRYENKPRLRRFKNIPELIQLFREVATEQGTAEDLGLRVPAMRGDPQSDLSEDQVADVAAGAIAGGDPTRDPALGSDRFWLTFPKKVRVRRSVMSVEEVAASQEIVERVVRIQAGGVDPRADNMLKIGTDVRKLTLDGRLYDPTMPENPKGKLAVGADVIAEILARTAETPHWNHATGTQRVDAAGNPMVFRGVVIGFMDIATPKAKGSSPKKKGERQDWELTPDEFRKKFFPDATDVPPEVLVEAYYSVVLAAVQGGETIPQRVIDSMVPYPRYHQGILDAIKLRDNEGADAEENVEAETVAEILLRNQAYGALKEMLVARGVPAKEIAFIHEAKNQTEKQALIDRVNRGDVRVILGSTDKMGVGTNMQQQLVAEVDFDAPWRPGDLLQRLGRIDRPGNNSQYIEIYRIIQAGAAPGLSSGDAYMWQVLEGKAAMQASIMRGKVTVREIDDVGASLEFQAGVAKAAGSGNPLMQDLANLTDEQARLQILSRNERAAREALKRSLSTYSGETVAKMDAKIKALEQDAAAWAAQREGPVALTIDGTEHTGQAAIDAALEAQWADVLAKWEKRLPLGEGAPEPVPVATYRGFEILMRPFKGANGVMSGRLYVRGPSGVLEEGSHMGHTLLSINQMLGALPGQALRARRHLTELAGDKERIERDLAKPEQYAPRLLEVNTRIAEIERTLGINQTTEPEIEDDDSDPGDDEDDLYTPLFVQDLAPPDVDREQRDAILFEDYDALTSQAGQAVRHATSQQHGADLRRPDVLITEMMEFIRVIDAGGIISTGGFQGRAGVHGYRDPRTGNMHLRRITSLDVAAHEIGHFVEKLLFTEAELRPFRAELRAARSAAFGVPVSPGGTAYGEGFAEFVRLWLTDPATALQIAPTLTVEFEKRLLTDRRVPGLDEVFLRFQQEALRLINADIESRVQAIIASDSNAVDRHSAWQAAKDAVRYTRARLVMRDKITAWWGHQMQRRFNNRRGYESFTREADPQNTLPSSESPEKLAALAPAKSLEALHILINRGILDPITGEVDESASIAQVLNLINPTGSNFESHDHFDVYAIMRRVLYLMGRDRVPLRSLIPGVVRGRPSEAHLTAAKHILAMIRALPVPDPKYQFLPAPAGAIQDLEAAVARMDQHYGPNFDAALTMLTKVEHGALDYAMKLGHYSAAERNNMVLMNELYVPLWKVMDNTEAGRLKELAGLQIGPGEASSAKVGRLHKLRGDKSQAPIMSPLVSSILNAQAIISAAERNAIAASIWKATGRASEEVLARIRQMNARRVAQGYQAYQLPEPSGQEITTLGKFAEQVPPPTSAVTTKVGAMREDVIRGFVDSGLTRAEAEAIVAMVPPEVWDHTATIFHMAPTDEALRRGIVTVYVDGDRKHLKINDRDLFESMLQADRAIVNVFFQDGAWMVRAAAALARSFRFGTVSHPSFIAANLLVRDWLTAMSNSGIRVVPHWISGILPALQAMGEHPDVAGTAHAFRAGGGLMFERAPGTRGRGGRDAKMRRFIKELAHASRTEQGTFWEWVKAVYRKSNPLRQDSIPDRLLNTTEMSTRYGVAHAHLKTPRPEDVTWRDQSTDAVYDARLATYDWPMMGSDPFVQGYSLTASFMRAGMNVLYQGTRNWRRFKGANEWNPRHLWLMFAYIMLEMLAWSMGHGDPRVDEESPTGKALSTKLIWPGSHKDMKEARRLSGPERTRWLNDAYLFPKEPGLAWPSTVFRVLLDNYWSRGEWAFAQAGKVMAMAMVPSLMPRVIVPVFDKLTNWDWFFDRPLEPRRLEGIQKSERTLQYTSPTAKRIVSMLEASHAQSVLDLSPIEVDHFIQAYFGRAVSSTIQAEDDLLNLVGAGTGLVKPSRAGWSNIRTWPGFARFLKAEPTWRGQSLHNLAEWNHDVEEAWRTFRAKEKAGASRDEIKAWMTKGYNGLYFDLHTAGTLKGSAARVNALYKEGQSIYYDKKLTDAEVKQERMDKLLLDAIDEAQTAMGRLHAIKQRWIEKGRPSPR